MYVLVLQVQHDFFSSYIFSLHFVFTVINDQRLTYLISKAIIDGDIPVSIEQKLLGPLCHACWMTLAQQILCLYAATRNPHADLKLLAEFCLKAYCYVWYQFRLNPRGTSVQKIYFNWRKTLLNFPKKVQKPVMDIFLNGTYWFHSENLLLAGLADQDDDIRNKSVNQIIKIRNNPILKKLRNADHNRLKEQKKIKNKTVRLFEKPTELNFNAKNYLEVISSKKLLYEPPFVRDLSDEQVLHFKNVPLNLTIRGNAVQNERAVKDTTKAAKKSTSESTRDAIVETILKDRKARPKSVNKEECL